MKGSCGGSAILRGFLNRRSDSFKNPDWPNRATGAELSWLTGMAGAGSGLKRRLRSILAGNF